MTRMLRSKKKKVLSVAWTGIAATLLIEGRTVHSTFQLPLEMNNDLPFGGKVIVLGNRYCFKFLFIL
jgi:hypothetical protein